MYKKALEVAPPPEHTCQDCLRVREGYKGHGSGARLWCRSKEKRERSAWNPSFLPYFFSQGEGKKFAHRHNERRDGAYARLSRVKKEEEEEEEEEDASCSSVRLYPCRVHGPVVLCVPHRRCTAGRGCVGKAGGGGNLRISCTLSLRPPPTGPLPIFIFSLICHI